VHIDDETLALLALGEDVLDAAERDHLTTCDTCAATVQDFAQVTAHARATPDATELLVPAPHVWARVHEELGLTGVPAPLEHEPRETEPLEREPRETGARETPPHRVPLESAAPGRVVPLHPARPRVRRAWPAVAAAACVALVLGVAGGVWWERRTLEPQEVTVATAQLQALPGWDGSEGQARVEESPDGRRQVVVAVDAPSTPGAFREVWLLTEDAGGLVSLGVLDGTEGRFDLPEGLDLAQFPLVDVSEEQFDGDPAHSGDSVVRGPLDV